MDRNGAIFIFGQFFKKHLDVKYISDIDQVFSNAENFFRCRYNFLNTLSNDLFRAEILVVFVSIK